MSAQKFCIMSQDNLIQNIGALNVNGNAYFTNCFQQFVEHDGNHRQKITQNIEITQENSNVISQRWNNCFHQTSKYNNPKCILMFFVIYIN